MYLSDLGIRAILASWVDLEVLSLLIFGGVCGELLTVTFKYLVEVTSEAAWTQAFLCG